MIWKNGLDAVSAEEIVAGFDTDAECGNNLKHLGISSTRPSSSRNGALDSVTDDRFALPLKDICHSCRAAGKTTYIYVFDQPNLWQSSSRAHHAVDLNFLIGEYDISFNSAAEKVGSQMRHKWIWFINGEKAQDGDKRFAFGPHGNCGGIDDTEYAARRRVQHFELLREMGPARTAPTVGQLIVGRLVC